MKRVAVLGIAAAALVAGLVTPAQAATTLTVWATGGEADAKVMAAAGKAFERNNKGVKVVVQAISWGDGYAKVLAAAAAKKGPDVFTGGLSWGISAGEKGALADLRKLGVASFVQPKVEPKIYRALIAPKSTAVYAVPFDLTLMMMFYDKKTLEKAGIAKAPATWAEFNAAAAKLKSTSGVTSAVYNEWGNGDWLGWFSWLYSTGGSLYDANCKVTINNAKGVAALEQYKKLYTDFGAPKPGVADWSMNTNLKDGKYGIGFSGNFAASNLFTYERSYKDWAVAPVPTGPGGKSTAFIGGRGISIMKYSKNQQLAAKFIRSLYDRNVVQAMNSVGTIENSIFLSPVISYADTIASYPDAVLATIKSQLKNAAGPPNCKGWEDAQAAVTNAMGEYLFGSSTAQAALDKAAAAMRKTQ